MSNDPASVGPPVPSVKSQLEQLLSPSLNSFGHNKSGTPTRDLGLSVKRDSDMVDCSLDMKKDDADGKGVKRPELGPTGFYDDRMEMRVFQFSSLQLQLADFNHGIRSSCIQEKEDHENSQSRGRRSEFMFGFIHGPERPLRILR